MRHGSCRGMPGEIPWLIPRVWHGAVVRVRLEDRAAPQHGRPRVLIHIDVLKDRPRDIQKPSCRGPLPHQTQQIFHTVAAGALREATHIALAKPSLKRPQPRSLVRRRWRCAVALAWLQPTTNGPRDSSARDHQLGRHIATPTPAASAFHNAGLSCLTGQKPLLRAAVLLRIPMTYKDHGLLGDARGHHTWLAAVPVLQEVASIPLNHEASR